MLYKLLNSFSEKRISKILPRVKKLLDRDLQEQITIREGIINKDTVASLVHGNETQDVDKNIQTILQRIEVEKQYNQLSSIFKNDQKRKYMINSNFYKFLEAIKFLYSSSSTSVNVGVSTAPPEIYYVINSVEQSFTETIKSLSSVKSN